MDFNLFCFFVRRYATARYSNTRSWAVKIRNNIVSG